MVEFHAQRADVIVRRSMLGGQLDQYVRVARANRRRIAVRKIQAAVREPNVVDDRLQFGTRKLRTNVVLGAVAKRRRLFNAGASRGAHVKSELTAIDAGEKILADQRQERE